MKLQLPKEITFYISVALGVIGFLGHVTKIPYVTPEYAFWFVFAGLVLLVLGLLVDGL